MQFRLSDEQLLIRDSARAFLDECAGSAELRAALEKPQRYDRDLWRRMSTELGWTGLAIADRFGGAGLGRVELAVLQHELGRRLVASPYFSTVCLAAPLIEALGTPAQQADLLGRIAGNGLRVAVALTGDDGRFGPDSVSAIIAPAGSGFRLDGLCGFVVYGHASDLLLVVARGPSTGARAGSEPAPAENSSVPLTRPTLVPPRNSSDKLTIVLVDPRQSGVTIEPLTMLDLTRPMARVRFENVRVDADGLLGNMDSLASPGSVARGLERALDLARVALAAESVGAAEVALEMTTQYVKDRVQFGRPVGSFQAVKHRLADMMVAVEAARSASWYAACVADELPDELPEAASIAKAACSDALYECAASAIQLHGGIGFTWEHDAHLYFKRARASSTLLGSPAWHRERIARLIGLGASPSVPAY
jgi:alkylation response protein AidB-like acyl-CoA dehydrogenase